MTMARLLFCIAAFLLFFSGGQAFAESAEKPSVDANAPIYVEIAPFIVPVLGASGPEELVSMIITLELAPGEDREAYVKQRLPRLNDAYVQTLYGALDRRTVKRGGLVDVTLVKEKLIKATDRVLGEGYVKDVLVQAVAQRRVGGARPQN